MNKWIGISLGAVVGLSHIGMIGLLSNRESKLPSLNVPVGPYTSYKAEVTREGYKIAYRANDPKTMVISKDIKTKGGFLGLANNTKQIVEEYTMDGAVHTKSGSTETTASSRSEACIKAVGSAEGTGRLVGSSIGASAAPSLANIPFIGWVAAGWVTMFSGNQGADIGGSMAESMSKDC
tara:strand:- start:5 stop:541 length:537 start_codon:yes stop_codon:yes gene_type:complete